MDDLDAHPDDPTLLDLIEGTLDKEHALRIEAHLDACRACGDVVRAAIEGCRDGSSPVEVMPPDAVGRMDVALASAWRARTRAIAASEIAEAAAIGRPPNTLIDVTPLDIGRDSPTAAPPTWRWSRRAVPVLAFVVLAALAGTSLQIGRDGGGAARSSGDAAPESEASTAPMDDAGTNSDTNADERAATTSPATAASPTASVGAADDQAYCIATRDATALLLPDGRIPRRVVAGPLGTYVVCG